MNEAIGYVRVSSEEQADSGLGLQAQRQRIAAFCAMKGLRLAEVYEEAGVSGGKPLASRPSGSRLLNAARRGKVELPQRGRIIAEPMVGGLHHRYRRCG